MWGWIIPFIGGMITSMLVTWYQQKEKRKAEWDANEDDEAYRNELPIDRMEEDDFY